jgi:hypothetical protein
MAVQQSLESNAATVDPENRLLSHFPTLRLDAEQLRDSILAVSDRLDHRLGGKSVPLRNRQFVFDHTSIDHTRYDSTRRSVYLPVIRNNVYSMFEQFDFPDPTMPTGHRNATTVAPQALLMMNSELVMDAADQMAANVMQQSQDRVARVAEAYRTALGREPSDRELQMIDAILGLSLETNSQDEVRTWSLICQSLLASNEFIYLR